MSELGLRKVAALLNGLPEQAVVALEAQLSADERQLIASERARSMDFPTEQRTAAVTDFLLALSADQSHPSGDDARFATKAAPSHLASVLVEEHPQAIALVLARLAPAVAAEILELLPVDLRGNVARRIATIESVDEATIGAVEAVLAERLAALPTARFAAIDGVAALGEILQSLDRGAERLLLNGLASNEPELAQAVACHTFSIEDVLDWSRATAQILLAKIETPPLAVALKQIPSESRRKILELLPAPFAERLRHAVAHLGNVPPAIVEQSRHTIATTLRDLQNAGKITLDPLPPTSRLVA
ncbi:MAG TPA: FliG C-terminal domain-containing protein [Pirellulales bacterium]|nr:FliG C-terminal domain-containing protein [Pirellulales bacterium]